MRVAHLELTKKKYHIIIETTYLISYRFSCDFILSRDIEMAMHKVCLFLAENKIK